MQRTSHRIIKRGFDIAAASAGLVAALPLIAAAGIAIRMEDGGPVLFRQERVGCGGRPFTMLKLRTMAADAAGPGITAAGDRRITGVGRCLRRCKIDELPQLYHVLRGEMSLVGPRPELARYVAYYDPTQQEVLSVRPGITDPASLRFYDEAALLGQSGDPEAAYIADILPEKLDLSIFYQRYATPRSDLKILLYTFWRVFRELV